VFACWGWVPPAWYQVMKAEAGNPERLAATARQAGLVEVRAWVHREDLGLLDPHAVLGYRLAMPHIAPWVSQLDAPVRAKLVRQALITVEAHVQGWRRRRSCWLRPDAIELLRPAAPEVDLSALRATATATRARLTEIADMLGEGELTRAEAQIARARATARLERAEAEITAATATSPTRRDCGRPGPRRSVGRAGHRPTPRGAGHPDDGHRAAHHPARARV
ncbi:MAG: hypothetical protein ACRD0H_26275, partial [Actinomycetes bacterium]